MVKKEKKVAKIDRSRSLVKNKNTRMDIEPEISSEIRLEPFPLVAPHVSLDYCQLGSVSDLAMIVVRAVCATTHVKIAYVANYREDVSAFAPKDTWWATLYRNNLLTEYYSDKVDYLCDSLTKFNKLVVNNPVVHVTDKASLGLLTKIVSPPFTTVRHMPKIIQDGLSVDTLPQQVLTKQDANELESKVRSLIKKIDEIKSAYYYVDLSQNSVWKELVESVSTQLV